MASSSPFVARTVFPAVKSTPRSYFLGHHRAGLANMKRMLDSIDLVVECRDYRLPLTSRNPLFEESLAGRPRMIVYTKKDLGSRRQDADRRREDMVRRWHEPVEVLFSTKHDRADIKRILGLAQHLVGAHTSLTGSKMLVVGMPNVGKSSLLNDLRHLGIGKSKVARTGAQPGVTRKIAESVKIVAGEDGRGGLYVVDTPGVFMPYVPDSEAMLKLALCGCARDNIVSSTILADYLLYHLNLSSPSIYSNYHAPTNDVLSLLDAVARKTGMLQKGGVTNIEHAALWLIQRWRAGKLGSFVLDQVTEEAYASYQVRERTMGRSLNQARKAEKEDRKSRQAIQQENQTSDVRL